VDSRNGAGCRCSALDDHVISFFMSDNVRRPEPHRSRRRNGSVFALVVGGLGRRVDAVLGGSGLCCVVCGSGLRASARFCDACGSPVGMGRAPGESTDRCRRGDWRGSVRPPREPDRWRRRSWRHRNGRSSRPASHQDSAVPSNRALTQPVRYPAGKRPLGSVARATSHQSQSP
jgi:hypothetical protein